MSTATKVQAEIKKQANPSRVALLQRFFKTGPGEYGAGDLFLGLTVPTERKISRQFHELPLPEIKILLQSKYHEHRQVGLFILVLHYFRAKTEAEKKKLAAFYLRYRAAANNWDLVDSSAPYILGDYYLEQDRTPIHKLVKSKNLWDRRIAVLTTFGFIKRGDFGESFRYAEQLLTDKEDLIHKAVGWMLREIGKRDYNAERLWLDKHYRKMPRTMLRYAIEKFPQVERLRYLDKTN